MKALHLAEDKSRGTLVQVALIHAEDEARTRRILGQFTFAYTLDLPRAARNA